VLILGIETSASQVSCAVGSERGLLASFAADRGPRHAEALVPAVATVLEAAGVTVADLEAVAVSLGPGLFTGLRVGIATAQALAFSRGIPLQGVPTLELVAQAARLSDRDIVALTDARRGEVFFAPFRPCPPGRPQRTGDDRVAPPAALVGELAAQGGPVLLVGPGVERHAAHFERLAAASPPGSVQLLGGIASAPAAGTVVELARPLLARSQAAPPGRPLRPIYVRAPDAEARWVERAGPVGGGPARGEPAATGGAAAVVAGGVKAGRVEEGGEAA
jgi:tRNA threonylcarbamoyladenosine biosynthesis protein TsaB